VQLRVVTDQPWDVPADVLVVPIAAKPAFDGPARRARPAAGGELQALVAFGEFSGKRYATALAAGGETSSGRVLAIGLGDAATLDRETVGRVAAAAERRLGGRTVKRLAIWITPLADGLDGDASVAAGLVARGVVEGTYDPRTIYRDEVDSVPPDLDELILIAPGADAAALTAAAERGIVIAEGANVARTLSNRASNDVSPAVLADEARAIAEKNGLWIDVIDADKATEMGMGMFMAVGRGSDNPPKMIVMRSGGEGERDALGRHLAIVGKGVCFDSGGISIKPSARMEEMKMDKTGACTVISAIATVARLAPGTPLLAVAPAVENMPGPHSTRPGDIVTALNGKKVDVTNTDAEGRLILGDALTYAGTARGDAPGRRRDADRGGLARARAPGDRGVRHAAGLLRHGRGRRRPGRRALLAAPADRRLRPEMDSWYGDLQNSGSPEGSLVKSGLFIREFVTKPWVHLDIAGTAYYRKPLPFAPRGATGVSHATARRARAGRRQGRLTPGTSRSTPGRCRFVLGLAYPTASRRAGRTTTGRAGRPVRPGRLADGRLCPGRGRSDCFRCGHRRLWGSGSALAPLNGCLRPQLAAQPRASAHACDSLTNGFLPHPPLYTSRSSTDLWRGDLTTWERRSNPLVELRQP
jgi:leucyl aminopeptidase